MFLTLFYYIELTLINNLALLYLALKDVRTADTYMQKAVQLGNEQVQVNQAIVEIKKGNYEEAARKLDGKKCIYNLALIQLMTGNTGNAICKLDCCMGSNFRSKLSKSSLLCKFRRCSRLSKEFT